MTTGRIITFSHCIDLNLLSISNYAISKYWVMYDEFPVVMKRWLSMVADINTKHDVQRIHWFHWRRKNCKNLFLISDVMILPFFSCFFHFFFIFFHGLFYWCLSLSLSLSLFMFFCYVSILLMMCIKCYFWLFNTASPSNCINHRDFNEIVRSKIIEFLFLRNVDVYIFFNALGIDVE